MASQEKGTDDIQKPQLTIGKEQTTVLHARAIVTFMASSPNSYVLLQRLLFLKKYKYQFESFWTEKKNWKNALTWKIRVDSNIKTIYYDANMHTHHV